MGRSPTVMRTIEKNLDSISRLWGKGLPLSQIADRIKVNRRSFQNWARAIGLPGYRGLAHGTISCYMYHHCRCEPCRKANRDKGKKLVEKRRKLGLCIQCKAPSPNRVLCARCRKIKADQKRARRRT